MSKLYADEMESRHKHRGIDDCAGLEVRKIHQLYGSILWNIGGTAIEFTDGTWLLVEGVTPPRKFHEWPWDASIQAGLTTEEHYQRDIERDRMDYERTRREQVLLSLDRVRHETAELGMTLDEALAALTRPTAVG